MNRSTRLPPGRTLAAMLVSTVALGLALGTRGYAVDIFYSQNFDGLTTGNLAGQDGWSDYGVGNAQVQDGTAVGRPGTKVAYLPAGAGAQRTSSSVPVTFKSIPPGIYETLSFDILFAKTITDYVGTPSLDIQDGLQLRAAVPNKESFLIYKAATDNTVNGAVSLNQLQFRTGAAETDSPTGPLSNVWYHVVMFNDYLTNKFDGLILNPNGSVFFDPPPQAGWVADGNVNYIGFSSDNAPNSPFYIDNVVVTLPEPTSACLLLLGALPLLRRRR